VTWGLGEALVDAVIAVLQAGMPDKLAELDTRYGDGETLAVPADESYLRTEKGLESVGVDVAFGVLHDTTTMNQWGWNRDVNGAHALRIVVIVIGGDHEALDRHAHRQLLAAWEVLNETLSTSGPGGFQIVRQPVPTMTFGGVFARDDDYEQSAVLSISFAKHENKS
jgi:hypothetical protein